MNLSHFRKRVFITAVSCLLAALSGCVSGFDFQSDCFYLPEDETAAPVENEPAEADAKGEDGDEEK